MILAEDTRKEIKGLCETDNSIQKHHTPWSICGDLIGELNEIMKNEEKTLQDSKVLVIFNLEFVWTLIEKYQISPSSITFMSDSIKRINMAENFGVETIYKERMIFDGNVWQGDNWKMKDTYDVVLSNPPYQAEQSQACSKKRGGGMSLWDKFVEMGEFFAKSGGYISFIHPSKWRKPSAKNDPMSPENRVWDILSSKEMIYLELHGSKEGQDIMKAGTRYDIHITKNVPSENETFVIDETGEPHTIKLSNYPFLPNCRFEEVFRLLAKDNEETCPIMFDRTAYGSDKDNTSIEQTPIYQYPLIHATRKDEIRYYYSSRTDRGHFGIPKVIFGEGGIGSNSIIDMEGHYGMTQGAMAIKVKTLEEAEKIKEALDSEEFEGLLRTACSWGMFRIDWRLFTHFKRDWWKEFINENSE